MHSTQFLSGERCLQPSKKKKKTECGEAQQKTEKNMNMKREKKKNSFIAFR